MEQLFDQYFNQILRNALRYSETFEIIIDNKDRQVTLTPNQKSELLERIKSDCTLKYQLLQKLANALEWPGTIDFFIKDGNIIIKSEIKLEDLFIRDVSLLSNIAKDLSVKEINSLCVQNKEFQMACENPKFWQSLVRESFGGKYKDVVGDYDWKKVYQGLRYYYDNKDIFNEDTINEDIIPMEDSWDPMIPVLSISNKKQKHRYPFWEFIYNNYYQALRVLIFGNTEFDNVELEVVTNKIGHRSDSDLLKYIFVNYKLTNEILNNIFISEDPEILKLYLDYQGVDSEGSPVKISNDLVGDVYDDEIRDAEYLSIEVFETLYNYLDGSWSPKSLLKVLSDMNYPNTDLVDFIVSKLPDDPKDLDLQRWLRDIIDSSVDDDDKSEQIEAISNKYKEYVKE